MITLYYNCTFALFIFSFALAGHRGTCLRPLHIFALLCFALPVVVDWNDVQQEHVLHVFVKARHVELQRRKHSPARKKNYGC